MVLVGGKLFKSSDSPYTNGEIASLVTTDDVSWNKLLIVHLEKNARGCF